VLTFMVEKWSDALPELLPLMGLLWDDVAVDKDRFVARCEQAKYKALEEAGALCLTTVRDDGELIGYYCALILPNPHYEGQGLMVYTDMYWVDERYRRGNLGLKLFLFSEEEWRKRGAVKAYSSHKLHRDRSKMFQVLDWKPTDMVYSKIL
jgi:predicted GNAT superfamily acetyltransferase